MLLQESPAGGRDDDAACDAQRRHGNAEEGEHQGADEQRAVQHKKAVEGDASRQLLACAVLRMPRDVEKNQRAAGRIDDWKGGGKYQQEQNAEILCESAAHSNRPGASFSAIGACVTNSHGGAV